jgi:hypothetical protein
MRRLIEVASTLPAVPTFVHVGESRYAPFRDMHVLEIVTMSKNSDDHSMTNRSQEVLALSTDYAFTFAQLIKGGLGQSGGYYGKAWNNVGLHGPGSWVVGGKPVYREPPTTPLIIAEIEAGNATPGRCAGLGSAHLRPQIERLVHSHRIRTGGSPVDTSKFRAAPTAPRALLEVSHSAARRSASDDPLIPICDRLPQQRLVGLPPRLRTVSGIAGSWPMRHGEGSGAEGVDHGHDELPAIRAGHPRQRGQGRRL